MFLLSLVNKQLYPIMKWITVYYYIDITNFFSEIFKTGQSTFNCFSECTIKLIVTMTDSATLLITLSKAISVVAAGAEKVPRHMS